MIRAITRAPATRYGRDRILSQRSRTWTNSAPDRRASCSTVHSRARRRRVSVLLIASASAPELRPSMPAHLLPSSAVLIALASTLTSASGQQATETSSGVGTHIIIVCAQPDRTRPPVLVVLPFPSAPLALADFISEERVSHARASGAGCLKWREQTGERELHCGIPECARRVLLQWTRSTRLSAWLPPQCVRSAHQLSFSAGRTVIDSHSHSLVTDISPIACRLQLFSPLKMVD